jgi:hypothetical protein
MQFARWVFLISGALGVLVVAPMYFMEGYFNQEGPTIQRPEFFYGFVGVTVAWQVMFLVIASDPARYRLAMLPAMLEKAGFSIAIPILVMQGRVKETWLAPAAMDGTWLVLFIIAFFLTPREGAPSMLVPTAEPPAPR